MKPLKVWDVPIRLTHWLIVLLVLGQFLSAESEGAWMNWHKWMGISVLILVLFRVLWGVVGSDTARFAHFVRGPLTVWRYLKQAKTGAQPYRPGHNPLGALSVISLLTLLAAQSLTGLFATDDVIFEGPLYDLVDSDTAERLTGLHHLISDLLLIFIALHIAAILFYLLFKRDNLIGPMITGFKQIGKNQHLEAPASNVAERWLRALVCLALSAAAVILLTQRVLF